MKKLAMALALVAFAATADTPPTRIEYVTVDNLGHMRGTNVLTSPEFNARISHTNPAFSNAVLAVQISTNDFAALYELKAAFADLPIDPVTGGISLGSLLAALAAAVAWLKKNKVQTVKLDDGSISKSSDGGVVKLDDFFGESNTLLGETIRAKSAQLALDEDGEIIVTMNTED